jgi:hypothetical protein
MTHAEAKEEAERLSRMIGRSIEVDAEQCACDHWPACSKCLGSGTEYMLRYGFCDHVVQDGPDLECEETMCAERELAAVMSETVHLDPFASAPLRSLSEVESHRKEEREVA